MGLRRALISCCAGCLSVFELKPTKKIRSYVCPNSFVAAGGKSLYQRLMFMPDAKLQSFSKLLKNR
jgi:hypothetical protein